MDKDLIAYLDERFHENSQQLASFREEFERRLGETSQQLASFREETDGRFRETSQQLASFREEADRRFRENSEQLGSFREETERRFEETNRRIEQVEDGVRHTQIMVEGLRGDVQLLAQGVAAFDGRLAAHYLDLKEEIRELKALLLLHLSYRDLYRRIG